MTGDRFEGRSVLVTGGVSGIGRAVVERFLQEGASVTVLDVDSEGLTELSDSHENMVGVEGDVTEYESNERAVDRTLDAFGSLDVLIPNAGVFDLSVRLEELDPKEVEAGYRELFDVNVLGYLNAAHAALEPLRAAEGSIVFTASCSSYMASTGGVFYVPSKHAVMGLVRRLAYELAPEIRVNGVAPGYVPTNLTGLSSLDQGQSPPSPKMSDVHPIGVVPEPEEYAGYYLFLADESESLPSTGIVLPADSGLSIAGVT